MQCHRPTSSAAVSVCSMEYLCIDFIYEDELEGEAATDGGEIGSLNRSPTRSKWTTVGLSNLFLFKGMMHESGSEKMTILLCLRV